MKPNQYQNSRITLGDILNGETGIKSLDKAILSISLLVSITLLYAIPTWRRLLNEGNVPYIGREVYDEMIGLLESREDGKKVLYQILNGAKENLRRDNPNLDDLIKKCILKLDGKHPYSATFTVSLMYSALQEESKRRKHKKTPAGVPVVSEDVKNEFLYDLGSEDSEKILRRMAIAKEMQSKNPRLANLLVTYIGMLDDRHPISAQSAAAFMYMTLEEQGRKYSNPNNYMIAIPAGLAITGNVALFMLHPKLLIFPLVLNAISGIYEAIRDTKGNNVDSAYEVIKDTQRNKPSSALQLGNYINFFF